MDFRKSLKEFEENNNNEIINCCIKQGFETLKSKLEEEHEDGYELKIREVENKKNTVVEVFKKYEYNMEVMGVYRTRTDSFKYRSEDKLDQQISDSISVELLKLYQAAGEDMKMKTMILDKMINIKRLFAEYEKNIDKIYKDVCIIEEKEER